MNGTVLIVDDESHVRKTLMTMIESSRTKWQIAGEAANGQEAIDQLTTLNPDLVISDIRMPIMNGIQFVENVRRNEWDVSIILLTAFKDFSYAQSALRYGVKDFLLKPCPEEEVLKVLNREYEELIRKRHFMQEASEAALRSMILRLPHNAHLLDDLKNEILDAELWLIQVDNYFPPTRNYQTSDLDLLQLSVRNIIEEIIRTGKLSGYMLHIQHHLFAIFVQKGQEGEGNDLSDNVIQTIKENIDTILGIHVHYKRYGMIRTFDDLKGVLDRNEKAGTYDVFFTIQENKKIDEVKVYAETLQNELISLLIMGDVTKLRCHLDLKVEEIGQKVLPEARLTAFSITVALQQVLLKELDAPREKFDTNEGIADLYQFEESMLVKQWTEQRLATFYEYLYQWLSAKNQNIIAQAVTYMEAHYMEAIKLADVAAIVHLSPKYFSELFKQRTGTKFTECLTNIRMEKAKLLLRNTEMAITDVSGKVGYDDPNYFSTIFKKHYKKSPLQFRKM